jgi:GT2 family glycosyltransferase
MESPFVSILVLNWNGEKVIRKSLGSIRKLTYPRKELIVIDNNSTDSSKEIIRKEFPEFQLLQNNKNLGFAAGMNEGIKRAKGSLILLYNNDAISHPESLSKLVNRILSDKSIGVVGGLILFYEPKNVVWSSGGMFDLVTGTIWSEGLGQPYVKNTSYNKTAADIDYLSGCVLLIRREVFEKIGLLDEGFFMAGDDIDFCLRARRDGCHCFLDSSAIIWHIGSHTLRQMPIRGYVERQKSDFRTILLHVPIPLLISALFFQLFIMPFGELFLFRNSQMSVTTRFNIRVLAFRQNLRDIRKTLRRRKQIAKLGPLNLKVRTVDLVRFGLNRIKHKEYFMGKMFQKNMPTSLEC